MRIRLRIPSSFCVVVLVVLVIRVLLRGLVVVIVVVVVAPQSLSISRAFSSFSFRSDCLFWCGFFHCRSDGRCCCLCLGCCSSRCCCLLRRCSSSWSHCWPSSWSHCGSSSWTVKILWPILGRNWALSNWSLPSRSLTNWSLCRTLLECRSILRG